MKRSLIAPMVVLLTLMSSAQPKLTIEPIEVAEQVGQ
jgi:hypothetical protein